MNQKLLTKLWYLKKADIFSDFSENEMAELERMTVMKNLRKGEILYLAGEQALNLYILKHGVIKISRILTDGRELIVELLKPGEIFGELEAMDQSERDSQATACEDAMLCVMKGNNFTELVRTKPRMALRVTKLMGLKRRTIENRIENILFKGVAERVASLLLDLAGRFGRSDQDTVIIDLVLSHQEIADLVGAVRVTVTETLSEFRKLECLDYTGRKIILKDIPQLKSFHR